MLTLVLGGRGALSHRHTRTTTTKNAPHKHRTDTHARRTHNVDTPPRVNMPTTREVHAASAACVSYAARHARTRRDAGGTSRVQATYSYPQELHVLFLLIAEL